VWCVRGGLLWGVGGVVAAVLAVLYRITRKAHMPSPSSHHTITRHHHYPTPRTPNPQTTPHDPTGANTTAPLNRTLKQRTIDPHVRTIDPHVQLWLELRAGVWCAFRAVQHALPNRLLLPHGVGADCGGRLRMRGYYCGVPSLNFG
jgi:hypothetical protein